MEIYGVGKNDKDGSYTVQIRGNSYWEQRYYNYITKITIIQFIKYLTDNGWSLKQHDNSKLCLFHGINDDNGQPIGLIIPRDLYFSDTLEVMHRAISCLSILENRSHREIATDILSK